MPVSRIQGIDGRNPLCPSCRRMTRLQKRSNGLVPPAMADPLVQQGQTSVEYSNVGRKWSKHENLEIGFAWCGKCSHTPWEYFARVGTLQTAKNTKIIIFRFWGGLPPYPTPVNRVRGRPNRAITLVAIDSDLREPCVEHQCYCRLVTRARL